MYTMDDLKAALAQAGFRILECSPRDTGVNWMAEQLVLELSVEPGMPDRYLTVTPFREQYSSTTVLETVSVAISGIVGDDTQFLDFQVCEIKLEELMPKLQNVCKTLIAAFKLAKELLG